MYSETTSSETRYISPFAGLVDSIVFKKLFVSFMLDLNLDVSGCIHFVRNSEICSVTEFTDETIGLPGISGLCIFGKCRKDWF